MRRSLGTRPRPLLLPVCLLLFGACSPRGPLASATAPDASEETTTDATPDDLPSPGEWRVIEPGGETRCARGAPFRFYVRGGDPARVLIDFAGGGACWEHDMCAAGPPIYKTETPTLDAYLEVLELDFIGGLQQVDDAALPMHGWTYVHIPYCTGDVHMGDAAADYGDGLVIQHRGAANVRSALDWVEARYGALEQVTLNGCSAGSLGAFFHAPDVAARYPDAALRVLGDSGLGLAVPGFLSSVRERWGVRMPTQIERLQAPEADTSDLFAGVAARYPEHRFAVYSTAYDADQTFFYAATGGAPAQWPALARSLLDTLRAQAPNLTATLAPGPTHCVTPYEHVWTRRVEGVTLAAWIDQLVHGDDAPADLLCEGEGCRDDPLCASCEPDDVRSFCDYCVDWKP